MSKVEIQPGDWVVILKGIYAGSLMQVTGVYMTHDTPLQYCIKPYHNSKVEQMFYAEQLRKVNVDRG